MIGLGLRDGDISARGLESLAAADIGYAELYTNSIAYDLDSLADETGTRVEELDRAAVEDEDRIVAEAEEHDVAFLVSGDPLIATTHQDILFRARASGIATEVVHAPSVLTAVAETGLSIYKFGRTTTLVERGGAVPGSVTDAIDLNRESGLHTLVLLDIGMEVGRALDLLEPDGELLACARLGTDEADIRYGPADALRGGGFGTPAALVLPGDLSDAERERLDAFRQP